MNTGVTSFSLSTDVLNSYLSNGATTFTTNTIAGTFSIPVSDLLKLIGNGKLVRFVLNGNTLEIYVDGSASPVMVLTAE